uniref:Uncharacterized protein n=1 Tax=Salix viminalis TaxID=40686 RepID=A0A6N2LFZ4_SALVM
MDSARQSLKSSSCYICWDYCSSFHDRSDCIYDLLSGSYFQCYRYLSSHVIGSCRRLLGSVLRVSDSYIHRGIISSYSCHFHCHVFSNCSYSGRYRLDCILLDCLVGDEEKCRSCQALINADWIGNFSLLFFHTFSVPL